MDLMDLEDEIYGEEEDESLEMECSECGEAVSFEENFSMMTMFR